MHKHNYKAGELYTFRIFLYDKPENRDTHNYGVLKILDTSADDARAICVVALEYYSSLPPTLTEARRLPVQRCNRYSMNNRPAIQKMPIHFENDMHEFTFLGKVWWLTKQEKQMAQEFSIPIGAWIHAGCDPHYEWRWKHDREAFMLENSQRTERDAKKRRDAEERYKTRLRGLTWDMLLDETQFQDWDNRTLIVPKEYTDAARQEVRSTIHRLMKLGPKPKRKDVRLIIKRCVEWFNTADGKYGYFIETEEREDIYQLLEELTFVARQKVILDEVDEWRQW